ncbi:hypothetical protein ACIQVL_09375 [Streptomyces sp. NPDC090499]|uniref:hypothetical protein n=1 Tax=Streptomyces sp. NPDC090499 TaxID=3365965 RepID=UPI0038132EEC
MTVTADGGLRLVGPPTPPAGRRRPAVLLLHGSGRLDRDPIRRQPARCDTLVREKA